MGGLPSGAVTSVLVSDTSVYTVAAAVLDAVRSNLLGTAAGPPSRWGVVNGAIAWDNCECGGGQLVVAPSRMYLTDVFPAESFTAQFPCSAAFMATDMVLQVIRCAPMPAGNATAPSTDALDASAQTVLADAYWALRGVACTLPTLVDTSIVDYAIRSQVIVGPQGGCVGSEIQFTVAQLFSTP